MISLYLCCARVRLSKHSLGNSYTRIRSAVIMNPGYAYNGEIVYCYFKIYRKYIKRQKKNLYYVDKVGSALEMYVVNEGNYTKKWI